MQTPILKQSARPQRRRVREAAETLKPVSESERENDLSFSHSNKGSSGNNKGAIKNKVV